MARTKQTARASTGGKSCNRGIPRVPPPLRSDTPTHRSVTEKLKRVELGLLSRSNALESFGAAPAFPPSPFPAGLYVFGFPHLPSEIRRMIYAHALTSSEALQFKPPAASDVARHFIAHLAPDFPAFNVSLLCVSKAVHAEALPILYGQNTFQFYIGTSRTGNASGFLVSFGPSPYNTSLAFPRHRLPLIRRLKITLITERSTHYVFSGRRDGVYDYTRLNAWICTLARAISKGQRQGAPLRDLVIDYRRGAHVTVSQHHLFALFNTHKLCNPEQLVVEDEHMLDPLKVLRGVGRVTLLGEFTALYQKQFCEQITKPLKVKEVDGITDRGHVLRSGRKF